MKEIILTTRAELRQEIKSVFLEVEMEKRANQPTKLYTINQVAKQLGKAHATISKYVKAGLIKTTKSGLISENAINNYLET